MASDPAACEESTQPTGQGSPLSGIDQEGFATRHCAHCDTVNAIGAMRAYVRAPAAVLGCPACDEFVPRMVETVNATYFDARGASYLRFDRR